MKRSTRLLAAAMLVALVAAGCGKEKKESTEPESFAFTIYPGSRYLAQLTDLWKQAR
jgi:ABC-type glycerol-3-phosphate transport system substrate-binding protein